MYTYFQKKLRKLLACDEACVYTFDALARDLKYVHHGTLALPDKDDAATMALQSARPARPARAPQPRALALVAPRCGVRPACVRGARATAASEQGAGAPAARRPDGTASRQQPLGVFVDARERAHTREAGARAHKGGASARRPEGGLVAARVRGLPRGRCLP